MPQDARKPYPKPWLQHIRGSDGERSPKISALKISVWGSLVQLMTVCFFGLNGNINNSKGLLTPRGYGLFGLNCNITNSRGLLTPRGYGLFSSFLKFWVFFRKKAQMRG